MGLSIYLSDTPLQRYPYAIQELPPLPAKYTAPVDDRALLDRIRQGDQSAFDTVFRAHYAPLVGVAEGMLRSRALAEEIVQDVMLELWKRRESLAIEDSLRAYLFRSTRNRSLNHLRHLRV